MGEWDVGRKCVENVSESEKEKSTEDNKKTSQCDGRIYQSDSQPRRIYAHL